MKAIDHRQPPIWLVSALLGAGSLYLAWTYLRELEQLADAITLPTFLLVIGFMAAEYFVVHLHFRSESITFSFIALPLIFGALFAPPIQVWAAMTMGAALGFMFLRKQALTKAAFNTANFSLQAAVALYIMHTLGADVDPLGPRGWFAAAAAAVGSTVVADIALFGVVSLVERRVNLAVIRQAVFIAALTAFTSASLALVAATLIDARPESLLLLLAPLVVLGFVFRSFVTEREHRERVQHMHESASQIRAIRHHSEIPAMLVSTSARMRAGRADFILLPEELTDQPATWFSAIESVAATQPLAAVQQQLAPRVEALATTPQLVAPVDLAVVEQFLDTTLDSALVGVVRCEGGLLGLLAVGNRMGDVTNFTADDLAMFSTVVDQLTLALENNELGQTVTELKRVEQELSVKAHHDPLTGLANRELLALALADALESQAEVSVLYLDLDDFKVINDGLGHNVGDAVLVETSRRLQQAVGPRDCVARLGGDEFAVVLVDSRHDLLAANRLLDIVNKPIVVSGHEVQVGASIGLTRAHAGQDQTDIIASADAAMYISKHAGKGLVTLNRPTTPTRIRSTS